jgi:GxxExxY protein
MSDSLAELNARTERIIGLAVKVHRALGPGLLESVYIACLAYELRRSGLRIDVERRLPVEYEDVRLDCGFRLDIVVENEVILEIKSIKALSPIHTAQILTYLKLTGYPVGLLLNFNMELMKQGIKRLLNPNPGNRLFGHYPKSRPNDIK